MISKACDRCERSIEVGDDKAGQKVECPYCGDTNVMPARPAMASTPAPSVSAERQARMDRAAAAGYPPDHGPEQRVLMVRPAWVRSRPAQFFAALIVALAGLVFGAIHLINPQAVPMWAAIIAVLALVGCGGLIVFWWFVSLSAALEVTNKRTVSRRGLFSRSTSEVLHDNIRNVQIEQTFWQRMWGVGSIGISSSGQDGIEIQMERIPGPQKLQQVIDLYRPLD